MKILLVHPGATWATADVWRGYRKALQRAGHEVIDYALAGRIVAAGGWLNYSWKKSGLPKERKPTRNDILYAAGVFVLEKALHHRVDWILVISAMYLHPEAIVLLRRAGLRVAMIMTESPYDDEGQKRVAALANCIFTNERTSVDAFREVCHSSHYLAHAYDPEVHQPHAVNGDTPAHDVVFVGTGFQERCEMLRAVDWDGIDLGLYGSWMLLGGRNQLRQHLYGGVIDNRQAADMYQAAGIGLNIHRTSTRWGRDAPRVNGAESVNPRVIELAAGGVFCLSDWRAEMSDLFGYYVPRFSTGEEMGELVHHYLGAPEERREIAERMRQDVQGQTFDVRATQVVEALEAT